MLPKFSLATPTVADCPFAVLGGAEERLVLLSPLLPQPATPTQPVPAASRWQGM